LHAALLGESAAGRAGRRERLARDGLHLRDTHQVVRERGVVPSLNVNVAVPTGVLVTAAGSNGAPNAGPLVRMSVPV